MLLQKDIVTLEKSLVIPCKVQHIVTINSATPLLDLYVGELKVYVHTKTCMLIFMAFTHSYQKLEMSNMSL